MVLCEAASLSFIGNLCNLMPAFYMCLAGVELLLKKLQGRSAGAPV